MPLFLFVFLAGSLWGSWWVDIERIPNFLSIILYSERRLTPGSTDYVNHIIFRKMQMLMRTIIFKSSDIWMDYLKPSRRILVTLVVSQAAFVL